MYNALILSQCKEGDLVNGIPRSWRRMESQVNSVAVEAIALYSAFALDRATMGYFLAL